MIDKIKIKLLSIILTEKCNLKCSHCMRGEQSNKSIDLVTLNNLLSQIDEIAMLSITGGEPFLEPNLLNSLIKLLKHHHIKLDAFSFVTNGTIYDETVLNSLKELTEYATEEAYPCRIGISHDKYHTEEIKHLNLEEITKKAQFLIRDYCKKNNIYVVDHNVGDKMVINQGRALSLNMDKTNIDLDYETYDWDKDKKRYYGGMIVDTRGNIFDKSDASYETIFNNKIGNINEDSLVYILNKKYLNEDNVKIFSLKEKDC